MLAEYHVYLQGMPTWSLDMYKNLEGYTPNKAAAAPLGTQNSNTQPSVFTLPNIPQLTEAQGRRDQDSHPTRARES